MRVRSTDTSPDGKRAVRLIGFLTVHVAMLAGASAQECPVSVRLNGRANSQGFPVLYIHLARQVESLATTYVRFPEALEANDGLPPDAYADDLPPEAFENDDDLPPEAFEDDDPPS